MIGIYKITNKINGKVYIGQSSNIERRFSEHKYKKDIVIDMAIHKYGAENFTFEIIEECPIDKLNEKETYWIKYYDSVKTGYNCNYGGSVLSQGENNSRAKLAEEDVIKIRIAYKEHKRRKEVYKDYENKITFSSFESVWDGSTWSHVMPEVFTKENKIFYSRQATNGELSDNAIFSDKEVLEFRQRYVNETAREIWESVKGRCSYQTMQQILWGRRYKHLPIYLKKTKTWIEPVSTISEA